MTTAFQHSYGVISRLVYTLSTGRAFYNVGGLNGLTFFAPQINLASNPLWGRNMECPGEDPHLTSVYAYQYVTGMQGGNATEMEGKVLKTVTTPKHFMGTYVHSNTLLFLIVINRRGFTFSFCKFSLFMADKIRKCVSKCNKIFLRYDVTLLLRYAFS